MIGKIKIPIKFIDIILFRIYLVMMGNKLLQLH